MPEVRAPFGIAIGAFLLDPHRRRQHEIGGLRRHGRIGIGDNDEIFRIAVAGISLFLEVGGRLQVIVDLHPIGIELAVAQHAVLQHRVIARLRCDGAFRQFPDLFGRVAMPLVGHQHVRRQPVRERADFACRAAGRRLSGERERTVAWL